ncbi:hypothetical protein APR11_004612 [Nocardia amikacinitolerans]|nr:hypothetical protein [Nocardia amikacinitolerans]
MALTDRPVEGRSNSMFRRVVASRVTLSVLVAFTLLALAFLALVALHPALRQKLLPSGLEWFGEPGSWLTITIVVAAIVLLCVGTYWSRREDQSRNVTVMIVAGLTATTLVMGLSAFWQCNDEKPPTFFTPLMWTLTLMRGSVEDHAVKNEVCPSPVPVALDVARLSALGAILVGVAGVVIALLASQVDRIRVRLAKSVTVVVGIDDDAQSMVTAVARTLARNSLLVLITTSLDSPCAAESRRQGARIISVDLDRPEALESLSLWKKLDRLYLMASDPTANLIFLGAISRRMSALGPIRRIPLIVRIDDPWQAEVWRAKQFGGSDTRWAADAVGKYEVTARRLLDQIVIGRRVTRILVCGTSPLTLALCADIAQRYLERSYFTDPLDAPLPTMTLVGEHAEEYRQDHEFRQEQHGLELADQQIHAVSEPPSIKVLTRLITEAGGDADVASRALIFVDRDPLSASPVDSTTSTRLAARFPGLPIYAWDPHARVTHERLPIVGQLRTFPS